MVKGITKQVVIVRPERGDTFEQAFFIVREGAESTERELLRQARSVLAQNSVKSGFSPWLAFFLGIASAGAIWLVTLLF